MNVRFWLPILEDIAQSDAFADSITRMTEVLEKNKEWMYISLDATLKTCMKLQGQESYRACKRIRDAAPFDDAIAWRRLPTARGRSGAVLLMHPLPAENSEHVTAALRENFSPLQLHMIEFVATDSPSSKFYNELRGACPRLSAICLDPIHLAIVYEYAQWNKKTAGSKLLRTFLSKFVAPCEDGDTEWSSLFFTGENSSPLNQQEEIARNTILPPWMKEHDARNILSSLDPTSAFKRRIDFINCIAAICALHRNEVTRKVTGANKEVYRVLWAACAPDRLEWLMNNVRIRMRFPKKYLPLLPSGTSSNEALHAELNSWNSSTNVMHRSTLNPLALAPLWSHHKTQHMRL